MSRRRVALGLVFVAVGCAPLDREEFDASVAEPAAGAAPETICGPGSELLLHETFDVEGASWPDGWLPRGDGEADVEPGEAVLFPLPGGAVGRILAQPPEATDVLLRFSLAPNEPQSLEVELSATPLRVRVTRSFDRRGHARAALVVEEGAARGYFALHQGAAGDGGGAAFLRAQIAHGPERRVARARVWAAGAREPDRWHEITLPPSTPAPRFSVSARSGPGAATSEALRIDEIVLCGRP